MSQQPPNKPWEQEFLQYQRKQLEEQVRIFQENMYGRKKPKTPSFNVVMEQIKAQNMKQQAQNRDMLNTLILMNLVKKTTDQRRSISRS
jgi:hypothetical protein